MYVVCGGVKNVDSFPSDDFSLRYIYEYTADKKRSAALLPLSPYACFTTFNFLISRAIFLKIKFNESFTQYGYEDALFGVELKQRGISIRHIDNPLIHNGLDMNSEFLRKTEVALCTLSTLGTTMQQEASVSRTAFRLKRLYLDNLFGGFYRISSPLMRKNLLSKRPSMFLFSLYKLGYYITITSRDWLLFFFSTTILFWESIFEQESVVLLSILSSIDEIIPLLYILSFQWMWHVERSIYHSKIASYNLLSKVSENRKKEKDCRTNINNLMF